MIAGRQRLSERDRWFGLLYGRPQARMTTAEDLVLSMDQAGVDRAVTFGFGWDDPCPCAEGNDYVMGAVRRYPDRLIGFACLQVRNWRAAERELARCLAGGMRGIGELMPDGQGFRIDDAKTMAPLAEAAERLGLPLLLHTNEPVGHEYPGKGEVGPELIYRFARNFPRVNLVCAHWGGGLPFYELMPEVREALANVFYDTAASPYLYNDAIFPAVASWAGRKLLWGTDYPLVGQRRFLERVQSTGLAQGEMAAILGGNAQELLRL